MNELSQFLNHLKQPEYIHVLLNPLPLYGMAIGFLMLLGATFRKSRGTQIASLILIALIGGIMCVVVKYGESGYDRVYSMSNPDAQTWLKIHTDRTDHYKYVIYGTGILSVLAIIALMLGNKAAQSLILLTLFAAGISIGVAAWISHAGGQIRHSEFRDPPPEFIPEKIH